MAKASKKNVEMPAQAGLLEPETDDLGIESPAEPDERPEFVAGPNNFDFKTDPEPEPEAEAIPKDSSKGGRPRKFGEQDQSVLDRLLNLESWEGVWAYVYRVQPFSNRLVGGNRKVHVKRWDSAFDIEDLMNEAGSGVYQVAATKLNSKTGKRPMFDSGEIRIFNMNHPPKIPPGEWIDDPRNKEWAWAKEAIFRVNQPPAAPPPPPPPDPLIGILEKTIDRQETAMQELRKEMRDNAATTQAAATAAASAPKSDPFDGILKLFAPFLPALAKKLMDPPPDPMAALTAAIALMKQMAPAPAAAASTEPETGLSALDRHLEISKKIEELHPAQESRNRSKMEGWQEFGIGITRELKEILAPLFHVVAVGIAQKQREAAQQQQQQQGNQPQTQQPRPASNPQGLQVVQPPPTQTNAQQPAAEPKQPRIEVIAAKVLDLLESKDEQPGYLLGDWYIEEFGMDEFNEVRVQGKNRILDDIGKVQATASELAKYFANNELDALITEFLTWEAAPDSEAEESTIDEETTTALSSNPWMKPVQEVQQ